MQATSSDRDYLHLRDTVVQTAADLATFVFGAACESCR